MCSDLWNTEIALAAVCVIGLMGLGTEGEKCGFREASYRLLPWGGGCVLN